MPKLCWKQARSSVGCRPRTVTGHMGFRPFLRFYCIQCGSSAMYLPAGLNAMRWETEVPGCDWTLTGRRFRSQKLTECRERHHRFLGSTLHGRSRWDRIAAGRRSPANSRRDCARHLGRSRALDEVADDAGLEDGGARHRLGFSGCRSRPPPRGAPHTVPLRISGFCQNSGATSMTT